jgi:hypothetical protein
VAASDVSGEPPQSGRTTADGPRSTDADADADADVDSAVLRERVDDPATPVALGQ